MRIGDRRALEQQSILTLPLARFIAREVEKAERRARSAAGRI
jgi:hypothetical protein